MKEDLLTDDILRQYLLGKVDEGQRARIEQLFITDSRARLRVLAAEQDLLEDYLEDSLTAEDKAIFLSHYAQTPDQRRKLRINKTIKDWAVKEAQASPVSASMWSRFLGPLRLRRALMLPITAVILIAVGIAYVWLNRTREYRTTQAEVAQLNTPASLSQTPPHMISLQLAPVTVRGGETQNQLTIQADTKVVELQLPVIPKEEYSAYRAVVYRVEVKAPIVTVDVKPEQSNPVRIRVPAYILSNGSYRIELSGIAADGSAGSTEEYTLAVN